MGEAKRRRESDPFYGQIPKAGKGIVVSPPVTIGADGSFRATSDVDAVELRRAVLFWDRIVKPTNNLIHLALSDDEKFLKECGLLNQLDVRTDGLSGSAGFVYAHLHLSAFSNLEKAEPGLWALSEGESSFNLKADGFFKEGRGALVELHRAIPLPTADVPLHDLLEFKKKRRDEILSLTLELDGLFARILQAEETDFELRRAIREIDQKCSDVVRVGRESRINFSHTEMTYGISLEGSLAQAFLGAGGGFFLGQQYELPALGALLGAGAGLIKFNLGIGGKLTRSQRSDKLALSPYRVVSRLMSEPI